MITAISKQNAMNVVKHVFETLEKLGGSGKSATRFALKEVRETYNSMTSDAREMIHAKRPEDLREEVYLKYFPYFRGGI